MSEPSDAQDRLSHGAKYPFDVPDSWWKDSQGEVVPAKDWAHAAARGVIADLSDRHTIKRGFENVDEGVRREIVESLAQIIRLALVTITP